MDYDTDALESVVNDFKLNLEGSDRDKVMSQIFAAYAENHLESILEKDPSVKQVLYTISCKPGKPAIINAATSRSGECLGALLKALSTVKASMADATVGNSLREFIMRDIFTAYANADLANVRKQHIANELIYSVSYKPRQTAVIEFDYDAMQHADDDEDENIPDDKTFDLLKSNSEEPYMRKSAVNMMLNYFKSCPSIYDARNAVRTVMTGLLDMHLEHYKIADSDAAEHAYIEATALGNKCEIDFHGDVKYTDDEASDDAADTAATDIATTEPTAAVKPATDITITKPDFTQAFKDAFENSELDSPKNVDISKYNIDNCEYHHIAS
jgi:hypothetical protein